jgi:hypothetical protein
MSPFVSSTSTDDRRPASQNRDAGQPATEAVAFENVRKLAPPPPGGGILGGSVWDDLG